jgi:hypothetical protein
MRVMKVAILGAFLGEYDRKYDLRYNQKPGKATV